MENFYNNNYIPQSTLIIYCSKLKKNEAIFNKFSINYYKNKNK